MSERSGGAPGLRVFDSPAALFEAAALAVTDLLSAAIEARGRARLVLAGGSTPRALYRRLADEPWCARLAWSQVEFFFGDERCVSPASEHANHRMASESLLDPLGVRAGAVHRIQGELGPAEAARLYERELGRAFPAGPTRFDLALLGMGADGHTASLFPGSPALEARAALVAPAEAPVEPRERVTLTLPALNAARAVLFLVSGPEKAPALARVLGGADEPPLPAARVRPERGELAWMVDRAAARALGEQG